MGKRAPIGSFLLAVIDHLNSKVTYVIENLQQTLSAELIYQYRTLRVEVLPEYSIAMSFFLRLSFAFPLTNGW